MCSNDPKINCRPCNLASALIIMGNFFFLLSTEWLVMTEDLNKGGGAFVGHTAIGQWMCRYRSDTSHDTGFSWYERQWFSPLASPALQTVSWNRGSVYIGVWTEKKLVTKMSFGFAIARTRLSARLLWFTRARVHTNGPYDPSRGLIQTPRRAVVACRQRWISKLHRYSCGHRLRQRCRGRRLHDGPDPHSASLSSASKRPPQSPSPDIHVLTNGRLWTWASYVRGPDVRHSDDTPPPRHYYPTRARPCEQVCRIARRCRGDFGHIRLRPKRILTTTAKVTYYYYYYTLYRRIVVYWFSRGFLNGWKDTFGTAVATLCKSVDKA